jgi:hypothetical protein
MRYSSFWACLAVLALTAAGTQAQEYTIKFKHGSDPGKSVVVKENNKETTSFTVSDANGKVLGKNKEEGATEEVYTETVLEKGDKQSKKFKRVYEKANRVVDGKKVALPYEGRTIVFELKDGKYQASAEGKPAVDPQLLDGLARRASSNDESQDQAILPTKPVKVGDKWAVDIKALAKGLAKDGGLEIDVEKTKGDVTLTKAYQKEGAQFGVLDVTIKLSVKSLGDLKFESPATGDLKATLDVAIDGTSPAGSETSTSKLEGKGITTEMGQKRTIDLKVDSTNTKEISPGK